MKREINEKFDYHGVTYVVRETGDKYPYKCVRCGFFDHVDNICRGIHGVTGDCRIKWRGDRKEVIFEEQ